MIRKGIGLALGLVLATAMSAAAAVPAPPVNQNLGFPDTTFNNMNEAVCRSCHNQTPPTGIPVDPTYLPDRHHAVKGTALPPAGTYTAVKTVDADLNGVRDTTYDCLNCHTMTFDATLGVWNLNTFRNCMECHQQTATSGGTVHHVTTTAQGGDCAACHGSYVQNGLLAANRELRNGVSVAKWVPTYQPSLVTPWPSDKPNGGTLNPINSEKQGSCEYCHDKVIANATTGAPKTEPVAAFGGAQMMIFNNNETHHSTGFGTDNAKCGWCHIMGDNNVPVASGESIRTCENCHGISSLHNIQWGGQASGIPSTGTVKPGGELAGKGHIGNNVDCNGCHGYTVPAASAPGSGPTVPALYNLSASSVNAGAVVTMKGVGFVNLVQNPMTGAYDIALSSQVSLINNNGIETILVPTSVAGDTITFQVPATMANGLYKVAAKKNLQYSNPLNLVVAPKVAITSKSGTTSVTLVGTGFGDAPLSVVKSANSGMSVSGVDSRGRALKATVISWTNSKIVAKFSTTPAKVTVNSLFGSATTSGGSTGGKRR